MLAPEPELISINPSSFKARGLSHMRFKKVTIKGNESTDFTGATENDVSFGTNSIIVVSVRLYLRLK